MRRRLAGWAWLLSMWLLVYAFRLNPSLRTATGKLFEAVHPLPELKPYPGDWQ